MTQKKTKNDELKEDAAPGQEEAKLKAKKAAAKGEPKAKKPAAKKPATAADTDVPAAPKKAKVSKPKAKKADEEEEDLSPRAGPVSAFSLKPIRQISARRMVGPRPTPPPPPPPPPPEPEKPVVEAAPAPVEPPKPETPPAAPEKPAAPQKPAEPAKPNLANINFKSEITLPRAPGPGYQAPRPPGPSHRPHQRYGVPARPTPAAARPAPPPPPRPEPKPEPKPEENTALDTLKTLKISTQITVRELAEKMEVKPVDLIKKLFVNMGVPATITQRLEPDVAELVAADYGFNLEIAELYDDEAKATEEAEQDDPATLKPRPPIITIMGHVDHGKTTLLDALRESNVVDGEAGQITQHIGAYTVKTSKGLVTVLDTPGHAAFTAMRAHGVKVTDLVVLVVSAVDGVMPQTLEAINHAKAANVPIVVAINKMDLPTANPASIKQQLAGHGLNPEEWGGSTVMVDISALKRTNIDKLMEMVSIQAELMELKANPDKAGLAIVVEARLDSRRGVVCTVVCTGGTIKVGQPFVVGTAGGKVRAIVDDRGRRLESLTPGMPGELLGVGGEVPHAGDMFRVYESDKEARHVAETRKMHRKQDALIHQRHVTLLSLKSQVEQKLLKTLNVVLKTDVFGSLQAIKDSLEKLSTQEVAIHILHSGVGNVTESDVLLAKASNAVIFGFNATADSKSEEAAREAGVEVRSYKIIYDLFEDIKAAMSGMLEPEIVETVTGRAEILKIFDLSSGRVAGSQVREGKMVRNQPVRVVRGGQVVGSGRISGLKRVKDDVREVEKGLECGILLEGIKDFQAGDMLEAVTREERVRRITTNV
ncbi:MAG: translation initiation factor IF-2 [Elusimicrobia bacterium]|nr:MAG: translation initiation factor IF-2 [Elusimicrobiota bacterium]KAF0155186.1 MAG: translation initiation factor IF-2 [Elusimicrobiota bacterium]